MLSLSQQLSSSFYPILCEYSSVWQPEYPSSVSSAAHPCLTVLESVAVATETPSDKDPLEIDVRDIKHMSTYDCDCIVRCKVNFGALTENTTQSASIVRSRRGWSGGSITMLHRS